MTINECAKIAKIFRLRFVDLRDFEEIDVRMIALRWVSVMCRMKYEELIYHRVSITTSSQYNYK